MAKDFKFKFKPVKLKAPTPSTGEQLGNIFNVIIGTTLLVATLPLIGAASS